MCHCLIHFRLFSGLGANLIQSQYSNELICINDVLQQIDCWFGRLFLADHGRQMVTHPRRINRLLSLTAAIWIFLKNSNSIQIIPTIIVVRVPVNHKFDCANRTLTANGQLPVGPNPRNKNPARPVSWIFKIQFRREMSREKRSLRPIKSVGHFSTAAGRRRHFLVYSSVHISHFDVTNAHSASFVYRPHSNGLKSGDLCPPESAHSMRHCFTTAILDTLAINSWLSCHF